MIYDFIVLRCGLPIYTMNFDPSRGLSHDQKKFTLISGFFSAISTFVDSVDNIGQVDEIQMSSDLFFSFRRISFAQGDVLFVLSSDQTTPKTHRREIIKDASEEFLSTYMQVLTTEWDGKIESFHGFDDALVGIIKHVLSKSSGNHTSSEELDTQILGTLKSASQMHYAQDVQNYIQPPQYAAAAGTTEGNDRFNRYRTLQFFQQQYQNLNPAMRTSSMAQQNATPWADPSAWTTRGLSQSAFTKFGRSSPHPRLNEENDRTMRVLPHKQVTSSENCARYAELLNGFPHNYRENNHTEQLSRPSLFDIIPYKQSVTAGAFRDGLANDWIKVLFVAVDGRKNIATLAEQLNIPAQDVIKGCQLLSEKGLIGL